MKLLYRLFLSVEELLLKILENNIHNQHPDQEIIFLKVWYLKEEIQDMLFQNNQEQQHQFNNNQVQEDIK